MITLIWTIFIMAGVSTAHAGSLTLHQSAPATLVWDAPREGGKVAGYRVYVNGKAKDVGNVLKTPCPPGPAKAWVTAYNKAGEEGKPSNVVEIPAAKAVAKGTVTLRTKPTAMDIK
jgi:hypothetical protein